MAFAINVVDLGPPREDHCRAYPVSSNAFMRPSGGPGRLRSPRISSGWEKFGQNLRTSRRRRTVAALSRGNAVARPPRERSVQGRTDGELRVGLAHPQARMPGALARSAQAGESGGVRRTVIRLRHDLRESVFHREVRATNIRRALPAGRMRVIDRLPGPKAEAGLAADAGPAWRRPAPPSGRTFSRPKRGERDAQGSAAIPSGPRCGPASRR
jgi:hypothetical protein